MAVNEHLPTAGPVTKVDIFSKYIDRKDKEKEEENDRLEKEENMKSYSKQNYLPFLILLESLAALCYPLSRIISL